MDGKNFESKFYRNIDILMKYRDYLRGMQSHKWPASVTRVTNIINIPVCFEPYLEIAKKTAPEYDFDSILPTIEDVKESDYESFERYSKEDFKLPERYILDILVLSFYQTFQDLGFDTFRSEKSDILTAIGSFSSDKSAGSPTYRKKGDDVAIKQCIEFDTLINSNPEIRHFMRYPTSVFHRYQSKLKRKLEVSIRQVWALPFCIQSQEAKYFRNILENSKQFLMRKAAPASTYGRSLTDISDNILTHFRSSCRLVGSIDVIKFDSNVPFYFIAAFFAGIELNLDGLTNRDKQILKNLMVYFCFTPYAYGDDSFRLQLRGIPSGSLLTSLCGTFCTRSLQNYAFITFTKRTFAHCNAICLGDDNLFNAEMVPAEYMTSCYELFGFPIRFCELSYTKIDSIDFLGYKWDLLSRPTQELQWYLTHFIYPQRFYKVTTIPNYIMQTYRAIGISAPLYGGLEIFNKYIGIYDKVYVELLRQISLGNKPIYNYIGEDGRYAKLTVPLDRIISGGWRFYDKLNENIHDKMEAPS